MPWLFILFADIFEIAWPFFLKSTIKFSILSPLLVSMVGIPIMFILREAIKQLPAATVYATFAGIATAGTAIIGMVFFGESTNLGRVFSLVLIIVGLVGLTVFSGAE
jgi:quaternary ammonium compound-resistance protein SugE